MIGSKHLNGTVLEGDARRHSAERANSAARYKMHAIEHLWEHFGQIWQMAHLEAAK